MSTFFETMLVFGLLAYVVYCMVGAEVDAEQRERDRRLAEMNRYERGIEEYRRQHGLPDPDWDD